MIAHWTVKQYMGKIRATVRPNMEVYQAVKLFLKHRMSAVPVANERGELVGILAEQDCLDAFMNEEYYDAPTALVRDLMSPNVVTVDSEAEILQAAELFSRYKFHLLPVVSGQRLVGEIRRSDVIWAILEMHQAVTQGPIRGRTSPGSMAASESAADARRRFTGGPSVSEPPADRKTP